MNGTRRRKQTCPDCGGILEVKDGKVECLSCDFGQVDRRKPIPDGLNNWKEQG